MKRNIISKIVGLLLAITVTVASFDYSVIADDITIDQQPSSADVSSEEETMDSEVMISVPSEDTDAEEMMISEESGVIGEEEALEEEILFDDLDQDIASSEEVSIEETPVYENTTDSWGPYSIDKTNNRFEYKVYKRSDGGYHVTISGHGYMPILPAGQDDKLFGYAGKVKSLSISVSAGTKLDYHITNSFQNITRLDFKGSDTTKVTDMYGLVEGLNDLEYLDMSDVDVSKISVSNYEPWNGALLGTSSLSVFYTPKNWASNQYLSQRGQFQVSMFDEYGREYNGLNSLTSSDSILLSNVLKVPDNGYGITDATVRPSAQEEGYIAPTRDDTNTHIFWSYSGDNTKNLYIWGYGDYSSRLNDILRNSASLHQKAENIYVLYYGNKEYPTSFYSMFLEFSQVQRIYFANAHLEKVTTMAHMFNGCESLKTIEYENSFWNNNVCTNMSYMFADCHSLKTVSQFFEENWDISNVTNMESMFKECVSMEEIILKYSGECASPQYKLTSYSDMFTGCQALKTLDMSGMNLEKLEHPRDIYINLSSCTGLEKFVSPNKCGVSIVLPKTMWRYSDAAMFDNSTPIRANSAADTYYATKPKRFEPSVDGWVFKNTDADCFVYDRTEENPYDYDEKTSGIGDCYYQKDEQGKSCLYYYMDTVPVSPNSDSTESYRRYSYQMNDATFDTINRLNISSAADYTNWKEARFDKWYGSCFGLSSLSVLNYYHRAFNGVATGLSSYPGTLGYVLKSNLHGIFDVTNDESIISRQHLYQFTERIYATKNVNKENTESLQDIYTKMVSGTPEDAYLLSVGIIDASGKCSGHSVVAFNCRKTPEGCLFDVYDCNFGNEVTYPVEIKESLSSGFRLECSEWTAAYNRQRIYLRCVFTNEELDPYYVPSDENSIESSYDMDGAEEEVYSLNTSNGEFTISNGTQSAYIKNGNKISGDLEINAYGNFSSVKDVDKYLFDIPALSSSQNYEINISDGSETNLSIYYDNADKGFYSGIVADKLGQIIISGNGSVTTSFTEPAEQRVLLTQNEATTPWFNTTVLGISKGISLTSDGTETVVKSVDEADATIITSNRTDGTSFDNVPIGSTDITLKEGASGQCKILQGGATLLSATYDYNCNLGKRSVIVAAGQKLLEPSEPAREGYLFTGWYKDRGLLTKWDFNNDIVADDVTLYAGWSESDVPPADIPAEGLWVAGIDDAGYAYTSDQIKPEIRVYYNKTLLTQGEDYTLSYKNNINAYILAEGDNDFVASKAPAVVITGKNNYSGVLTKYFKINPLDINLAEIDDIVLAYNKKVQKSAPVVKFTVGDKELTLKQNKDYTVVYPDESANAYKAVGEYSVKITGKGNFRDDTVKVIKERITETTLISKMEFNKLSDQPYNNGDPVTPAIGIKNTKETPHYELKGVLKSKYDAMSSKQKMDYDYTYEYKKNTEIGTANVVVEGVNTYIGKKTIPFKITGTDIRKLNITYNLSETYTGIPKTPIVKVVQKATNNTPEKSFLVNSDFTVEYDNNINAGNKASITIKGINGCFGTVKKTFKIVPADISGYTVTVDSSSYKKGGATPEVIVKNGDAVLVKGKDYTVKYFNNKAVSDGIPAPKKKVPYVTVTGKGNYKGVVTNKYFAITSGNILDATADVGDVIYQNKPDICKPAIRLYDTNGKVLVAGTDYEKTVVYRYASKVENVVHYIDRRTTETVTRNPGDAITGDVIPQGTLITAYIKGKGNYVNVDADLVATFRYVAADISKATVKIEKQYYTGKPITIPENEISVKVGGTPLTPADYTIVSYTNNVNKGNATLTLKGTGNYGGQKTVKFTITARYLHYLVVFDKNAEDATGQTAPVIMNLNTKVPANQYKRQGYEFAGWSTHPGIADVKIQNQGFLKIDGLKTSGIVIKLYAQWKPVSK